MTRSIILFLAAVLPALVAAQSNCPTSNGWQEIVGVGCYLLDKDYYSDWLGCASECQVKGGHLAEIESQAEHDALVDLTGAHGTDSFFIGASDLTHEGRYRWLWSGKIVEFTAWGQLDPDGGLAQNCVAMIGFAGLAHTWADVPCSFESAPNAKGYPLCELDDYRP